jgi:hypothetical protein
MRHTTHARLKAAAPPRQRPAASRVPTPPRPSCPPPDRASRRRLDSLAPHAVVPTTAVRSRRHRAARRSPVDVAPHRRPRAGEPPVPRSSPVHRRHATIGSPSNAATVPRRRAPRVTRASRGRGPRPAWPRAVHPRGRGPHPHCVTGPSAVSDQWHSI